MRQSLRQIDLAAPTAPSSRLESARRRGESTMGVGAWLLAILIAGGYGSILWALLLLTWVRWPLLVAIGFVLWRHRSWVRRRFAPRPR